MESLDNISVLPKLSSQEEKDRTFKLIWVLDLVTDSSRQHVNLIFKNVHTNFIIIDSIPPELLSYCTVGSYFRNGKKLTTRPDDGDVLSFTINSNENNKFTTAKNAFSSEIYDFSINDKQVYYERFCQQQICFAQQINELKVIIPCFAIAATFYFKSTSLREAILSRKLSSLFHSCEIDKISRHARIFLRQNGNLGDAINIARFHLDVFAKNRLNLCINNQYAKASSKYHPIYVDFPTKQAISIVARGKLSENQDGTRTFVVFQILKENTHYPFDSIDVEYEVEDPSQGTESQGSPYPKPTGKCSGRLTNRSPSSGLVRHFLERSKSVTNINTDSIVENRIPVSKPSNFLNKPSTLVQIGGKVDLSAQPSAPSDDSVARAHIQENNQERTWEFEFSLDMFIRMVTHMRDQPQALGKGKKMILMPISNYRVVETEVYRRSEHGEFLTLKESYDNSEINRRRCAYIFFICRGRYVCIVEIDQTGIGHGRCSTRVLISDQPISQVHAEDCVKDYVMANPIEERESVLGGLGIRLVRRKHPRSDDEDAQDMWRTWLLSEIA